MSDTLRGREEREPLSKVVIEMMTGSGGFVANADDRGGSEPIASNNWSADDPISISFEAKVAPQLESHGSTYELELRLYVPKIDGRDGMLMVFPISPRQAQNVGDVIQDLVILNDEHGQTTEKMLKNRPWPEGG